MLEPAIQYRRSSAEKNNQLLSWQRPDKVFFAAGACHILAYAYLELFPDPSFELILLTANEGKNTHIYIRKHNKSFDFNGWNNQRALIAVNNEALGCAYSQIIITMDLKSFCKQYNHRLPEQFAFDPRPRANFIIKSLYKQS